MISITPLFFQYFLQPVGVAGAGTGEPSCSCSLCFSSVFSRHQNCRGASHGQQALHVSDVSGLWSPHQDWPLWDSPGQTLVWLGRGKGSILFQCKSIIIESVSLFLCSGDRHQRWQDNDATHDEADREEDMSSVLWAVQHPLGSPSGDPGPQHHLLCPTGQTKVQCRSVCRTTDQPKGYCDSKIYYSIQIVSATLYWLRL